MRYVGGMIPRTGNRPAVRADGTRLRIRGSMKHTFSSIDSGTRFLLACGAAGPKNRRDAGPPLRKTMRRMGKAPRHFMTDGLAAYARSCLRVFGSRTEHHVPGRMRGDSNNNRMGRFNGTLRGRGAAWRGLKRSDSPMIDCFAVYCNFVRPHSALGGRTPAEAACIRVEGDDRRLTLIRNAGAGPLREYARRPGPGPQGVRELRPDARKALTGQARRPGSGPRGPYGPAAPPDPPQAAGPCAAGVRGRGSF